MKVFIGPYKSWIGPYQLANILKHVGVSDSRCHDIGHFLAKTWIHSICRWIEKKRKRNIHIRIDGYDVWSLDHTLSLIIAPTLKKLKTCKHGIPYSDKSDAPGIGDINNDWCEKRWEWILDEMIWSFDYVVRCDYKEETEDNDKRSDNGRRLFAKYYHSLWD